MVCQITGLASHQNVFEDALWLLTWVCDINRWNPNIIQVFLCNFGFWRIDLYMINKLQTTCMTYVLPRSCKVTCSFSNELQFTCIWLALDECSQRAEAILNKISNIINKIDTELVSVLQGFQSCNAWNPSNYGMEGPC